MDLSIWRAGLWPNSWWVIRYLLPYNKKFYIPACYHDISYSEWWTQKDKERIDFIFYLDCLKQCDWIIDTLFALFYYELVTLFWFMFFNYKKNEHIKFSN